MLSLEIDGRWDIEDFTDVLSACESLYYAAAAPELAAPPTFQFYRLPPRYDHSYAEYLEEVKYRWLERAREFASAEERLWVARIHYASPGGIDLAGLGQAAEAVDRVIGRLLDFFTGRKLRRERDRQAAVETEIQLQKLYELKLENARRLLALRREFPEQDELALIPLLVREQDKITDRIAQGMITGNRDKKRGSA